MAKAKAKTRTKRAAPRAYGLGLDERIQVRYSTAQLKALVEIAGGDDNVGAVIRCASMIAIGKADLIHPLEAATVEKVSRPRRTPKPTT